jgi:hypothetical protein
MIKRIKAFGYEAEISSGADVGLSIQKIIDPKDVTVSCNRDIAHPEKTTVTFFVKEKKWFSATPRQMWGDFESEYKDVGSPAWVNEVYKRMESDGPRAVKYLLTGKR